MRNRSSARLGVLLSGFLLVGGAAVIAACVGDDSAVSGTGPGTTEGGAGADSTVGSGGDGGNGNNDSSVGADGGACACASASTALSCSGTTTACPYGCAEPTATDPAHCRQFDPTGAVEPTDLTVGGLKNFTGKNLKFYTETGQITTDDGVTEIRAANAIATKQEVAANGIGFRRVDGKVGIFQFKNLTIQAAESFHFNGAFGNVALALVATEQVTIEGKLELGCFSSAGQLYGYVPAASHGSGAAGADGTGPGGGKVAATVNSQLVAGGGGGSHSLGGGGGGGGLTTGAVTATGGAAGTIYIDPGFDPPLGGSAGGGGNGVVGGPGGGALQIVAGTKITIGTGSGPDAGSYGLVQGINVGGCGGGPALNGGASGGGSGGTILLEAPVVVGLANAGIASNGGGGGGLNGGDLPNHGSITSTNAPGGTENMCYGAGGAGGAGALGGLIGPSGQGGASGPTGCSGGVAKYGGGGGGSVGFIRILTVSGDVTAAPSFVISPASAPQLQKAKIATR